MNTEAIEVAQMLKGVTTDYLSGGIDLSVLKMQVEFANSTLNKTETLPVSSVSNYLLKQEVERRRDLIINEPDGEVRETMIRNLAIDL